MCKDVLEEIKVLVKGQVSPTLIRKISTIILNASRAFLAHHLFNEDGQGFGNSSRGETWQGDWQFLALMFSQHSKPH